MALNKEQAQQKVKEILALARNEKKTLTYQDVMNKLKQYGVDSVMLETLYDRNYEMFNEYELQRIINKLDAISSHLETAKKGAQRNINHWDSEIKDYDDK